MHYKRILEIIIAVTIGFSISNLYPDQPDTIDQVQTENPDDCIPNKDVLIFLDTDGNLIVNIFDTQKQMDSIDKEHFFEYARIRSAIRGEGPVEDSTPLVEYLNSVLEKRP